MPNRKRVKITEEQWATAVEAYELGRQHGVQIAADLGISSSTVSREFKRRGCVKGCRVGEIVAALEAALDEKARREAPIREARERAALARSAALDRLTDEMMKSIVAAEGAGDLSLAASTIKQTGNALGVKLAR